MSGLGSDTLFMVMVDVAPASAEPEFNAWYDDEHVPELLRVPGFLTGVRYRALQGSPRYVAMYDLADFSALDEPLFHQARPAHPKSTPATKRMWQHVRNLRRGVYQRFAVRSNRGPDAGPAPYRLLIGVNADAAAEGEFETWCARSHLPALADVAQVVAVAGYRLDTRSTDHQDPPGRHILIYDLDRAEAGRDPAWLAAPPGAAWAQTLADPSRAAAWLFYERIYPR